MSLISHKGRFYFKTSAGFREIIATTDSKMVVENEEFHVQYPYIKTTESLPRPSDAFLKAYCEKGRIDEVLVEYIPKQYNIGDIVNIGGKNRTVSKGTFYSTPTKRWYYFTDNNRDGWSIDEYTLKIAPDNTITIKPVKESWNREEVIKLVKKSLYDLSFSVKHCNGEVDKWIEQNL